METKIKTLGEKRVGVEFNSSNDEYIHLLKQKSAELVDLVNQAANHPKRDDETLREWLRLKALAMTSFEEGAMWAVKAATI